MAVSKKKNTKKTKKRTMKKAGLKKKTIIRKRPALKKSGKSKKSSGIRSRSSAKKKTVKKKTNSHNKRKPVLRKNIKKRLKTKAKKTVKRVPDKKNIKITRKGANRPTLLFLDAEDTKLKKIIYRLKRVPWINNVHVLSGNNDHRIALYTHVGNSSSFEKKISYLENVEGVESVFEYPAYKFATNGVRTGRYPYGAYFFLKAKKGIDDIWDEFRHSENLVEIHEVPGEYDLIMYTEAPSYEHLMQNWTQLCNTHKLKEIDASFSVPMKEIR